MTGEQEPRSEQGLREIILRLRYGKSPSPAARKDDDQRKLCVTPFDGNYGIAGYAIVLNGSPPHGCIISLEGDNYDHYMPASIFFLDQDRSRRMASEADCDLVRQFLDEWKQIKSTRDERP